MKIKGESRKLGGKDKELRDRADVLRFARELPEVKLYHCSDDVQWQNRMGTELMEWAERDDSRILDNFPLSKRLAPQWFYRMKDKNDYFAQCLQYAKAKIGVRLEEKIIDHPIHISKSLPLYGTLWVEAEEKKLSATKSSNTPANIIVQMPNFGEQK